MTSSANTIAAMGALKIADIAAAAEKPIIATICEWKWALLTGLFSGQAEPVTTVGPSSPRDPPKPTVSDAVIIEEKVL